MGEKLTITWAVVEASDEFDNMSVCAFEGAPADGIMADVICEITSLEEDKDAHLIAAAPDMYEAAFALCNLGELIARVEGAEIFDLIKPRAADFWRLVAPATEDGGCRIWSGHKIKPAPGRLNYGTWRFSKTKVVRTHRAAWMLANNQDVPPGLCVCHHCDVPPCCNPDHLFVGTVADNNHDRDRKGRAIRGVRDEATVGHARGEAHGCAKLTAVEVGEILVDRRSHTETAEAYGVTITTVSRIRRGLSWKVTTAPLRALASTPEGEPS